MKFAIVNNGQAARASKAAIEARALAETNKKHPLSAIVSWPANEREALGIYEIVQQQPALDVFERRGSGTLAFANGTVTETFAAVTVPLADYKAARITAAWAHCNELIQAGTVTVQSDTATTPVDHTFRTDEFTQQAVWQSKTIAINSGVITGTLVLTPTGELDGVTFTVAEFIAGAGAAEALVDGYVKRFLAIKKSILVAADHAAVKAIDITAGY